MLNLQLRKVWIPVYVYSKSEASINVLVVAKCFIRQLLMILGIVKVGVSATSKVSLTG